MTTLPRRLARLAAAAATACVVLAADAQVLGGGTLSLSAPFFGAGGRGNPLTGGTKVLVHSIAGQATLPMSGGTLTLTPGLLPAAPAAALDNSAVHAFPVPFRPARGDDRVTFRGLTANATVKIYTLSGRWVATLTKSDPSTSDLVWMPVANADGRAAASGVYFYVVNDDAGRASGKLMIIR